MQGNSGKCYLTLSANELAKIQIESASCEKLLAVKIDSKRSLDKHQNNF